MRHIVEEGAVEYRKVDDPPDAGLAREVECPERLGRLVGHCGIEQEERVNALLHRAHRGDVRHVSLDRFNARGDLTLDASSRTSARVRTLCRASLCTTCDPMVPVLP